MGARNMTNGDKIKITRAKGRPMLRWVGKKPLDFVKSFPTQLVEFFDPIGKAKQIDNPKFDAIKDNWQNLLFHGDNKEVLAYLLANGFRDKIDLIYIDPPFDSGANYVRQVQLRGIKEKTKLECEDYSVGEQIQYHDIWSNDNYLQFMYERLLLLKELLSEKGSIYVHVNNVRAHYLKIILDEIFGEGNFETQIVWKRVTAKGTNVKNYGEEYDVVLYYVKDKDSKIWSTPSKEYTPEQLKNYFKYVELPNGKWKLLTKEELNNPNKIKGRRFSLIPTININPNRPNLTYEFLGFKRTWKWTKDRMLEMQKGGLIIQTSKNSLPVKKQYLDERKGMVVNNLWTDIPNTSSSTRSGYPTEKNAELLKRIIEVSSRQDSIILDCFMGSGTIQRVAQEFGRKWIGVDINKGAIQTTIKELQKIIKRQYKDYKERKPQKKLTKEKEEPKHFSFAHYKVNDYDLKLLKTEAIELAIQHIGIQRTKTDLFFDGVLGNNLAKIIDFNHPLTLLDLQLIQDELKKRPDENRNVTIVCLGKELTIDPWVETYNKKHPVNKFEIIELRTDKKYGKFLIHKPSEAKVDIKRDGKKAIIDIKNFISPSIIERLNEEEKAVKVKIADFRSMIDTVLIDSDYNGRIFNIKVSDVPEKRNDLVKGKYEIDIPKKKTIIAVKIIDMLGEEVLITKEI